MNSYQSLPYPVSRRGSYPYLPSDLVGRTINYQYVSLYPVGQWVSYLYPPLLILLAEPSSTCAHLSLPCQLDHHLPHPYPVSQSASYLYLPTVPCQLNHHLPVPIYPYHVSRTIIIYQYLPYTVGWRVSYLYLPLLLLARPSSTLPYPVSQRVSYLYPPSSCRLTHHLLFLTLLAGPSSTSI